MAVRYSKFYTCRKLTHTARRSICNTCGGHRTGQSHRPTLCVGHCNLLVPRERAISVRWRACTHTLTNALTHACTHTHTHAPRYIRALGIAQSRKWLCSAFAFRASGSFICQHLASADDISWCSTTALLSCCKSTDALQWSISDTLIGVSACQLYPPFLWLCSALRALSFS